MHYFVISPGILGGSDSVPFIPFGDIEVGNVLIDYAFNDLVLRHLESIGTEEYFVLPKTHEAFTRFKSKLDGTALAGGEILSIVSHNPNGLCLHVYI